MSRLAELAVGLEMSASSGTPSHSETSQQSVSEQGDLLSTAAELQQTSKAVVLVHLDSSSPREVKVCVCGRTVLAVSRGSSVSCCQCQIRARSLCLVCRLSL